MHKKISYLIMLSLLILSYTNSLAQLNDYPIKVGLHASGLLPETDFKNDDLKLSYLGRAFLRFKVIDLFDIEAGAGYAKLAGEDNNFNYWETSLIPADLRLLLSPFNSKSVNPYAYAGIGFTKWRVEEKPVVTSGQTKDKGTDLYAPFGLGIEMKLSNSILLDLSGGYNYLFSDYINYVKGGDFNDGFWNLGIGIIFTGEGGSSDSDNDGLTKSQEIEIGTNPDNPDSDGDGLSDGLEFNQYKTDPLSVDSDGDGISDTEEIKTYTTNPNIIDTDKDGITDGDEILKYNTDPLREDSDMDGIKDKIEIDEFKTNPISPDTDKDGLKDGDEIHRYKTDPSKSDTDGDGILDGDEIFKFNTNPLKADTDGGSVNDKIEIDRKTNPLNPEDDIVLDIAAPIVLEGVTFETAKSELTPESEKMLLRVLNTLNAYQDIKVEISGYTDNVGNASKNLKLSQQRADAVRYWLINKGIAPERIVAKGYGEDKPIADNNSPEGRRLNRRIEFVKIN
ncbi:MAG: OmpA family protein [Ignavibacteriales bacterium]|nr:OmpA family protein [Ignavibacteriales bacterium]